MDTVIKGAIGPFRAAAGVEARVRLGQDSEVVVLEAHGKYYEQTRLGNLFVACMTAGVIFPAPAATASNPITLANPAGSGKLIVPVSFDLVFTVLPGTPVVGTYGLFANTNPIAAAVSGTALTPLPGRLGSSYRPVANVFTTSTLPVAPTYVMPFSTKLSGAGTTLPNTPSLHIDFDGRLALEQGAAITPQQTAADTSNATVIGMVCWYEVAL